MAGLCVTILPGDSFDPTLYFVAFHLDGLAAAAADQVMVSYTGCTDPEQALAFVLHGVCLTSDGKLVQTAVDSGQADLHAHRAQVGIQLLRPNKSLAAGVVECIPDCVALAGVADHGGLPSQHRGGLTAGPAAPLTAGADNAAHHIDEKRDRGDIGADRDRGAQGDHDPADHRGDSERHTQ